jgi:hypothetical protein
VRCAILKTICCCVPRQTELYRNSDLPRRFSFAGSNNLVAKWTEFDKFKETTKLEELLFVGNPVHEAHKDTDYRIQIAGRIPWLKKLDGVPIDDEEREQGKALVG